MKVLTLLFVLQIPLLTAQQCSLVKNCITQLHKGAKCGLFPLLPDAVPPLPGDSGYILTKVRPALWHYSDDIYHAVIAFDRHTGILAVVDFPRSANSLRTLGNGTQIYLLVNAVKELLQHNRPRKVYMIYGHRHLDHIGAASLFYDFIKTMYPKIQTIIIGTEETRIYVQRRPKDQSRPPLPTLILPGGSKRLTTVVRISNDLILRLLIVGGHTSSDVVVHVAPHSRKGYKGFVHVADIVETKNAPFAEFTFTTDINAYMRALRTLLKLDFEVFSSGHGKLGDKRDVRVGLHVTKDVFSAAREAARTTDILDIIGRVRDPKDVAFRNNAWSFYAIIVKQADQCVKTIIRKWGCRLSSVDVFAESLCRTAVISITIEE